MNEEMTEKQLKAQIRMLMESQLNLDRKLNEILSLARSDEVTQIRLRHLEKEVDQIKRQCIMPL